MPKWMETVDHKEVWMRQEFGRKTMWMRMVRTWFRASKHNNMDPWNNNKGKMHSIQFNQPEVVMSNSEVTGRNEFRHESRQTRQAVTSSKTEQCGELD